MSELTNIIDKSYSRPYGKKQALVGFSCVFGGTCGVLSSMYMTVKGDYINAVGLYVLSSELISNGTAELTDYTINKGKSKKKGYPVSPL